MKSSYCAHHWKCAIYFFYSPKVSVFQEALTLSKHIHSRSQYRLICIYIRFCVFRNLFSFRTIFDKSLNLWCVLIKCLPLGPNTGDFWEAAWRLNCWLNHIYNIRLCIRNFVKSTNSYLLIWLILTYYIHNPQFHDLCPYFDIHFETRSTNGYSKGM